MRLGKTHVCDCHWGALSFQTEEQLSTKNKGPPIRTLKARDLEAVLTGKGDRRKKTRCMTARRAQTVLVFLSFLSFPPPHSLTQDGRRGPFDGKSGDDDDAKSLTKKHSTLV